MRLYPIPIYKDNYVWVIHQAQQWWVIDPGEAEPVIQFFDKHNSTPTGILVTHRHWDHVTGIQHLVDKYAIKHVIGPEHDAIPCLTRHVKEGETVVIDDLTLQVLETPGHTIEHICYYLDSTALFCGDTLFSCGCGRIFDGSMEALHNSLQRLAQLPPQTQVYCTHEYTQSNVKFALAVEPDNQTLQDYAQQVYQLRANNEITLPSSIAHESQVNPFLRTDSQSIKSTLLQEQKLTEDSSLAVFSALREWKNVF